MTDFITMYHPLLGNAQALIPRAAAEEYETRGWLPVNPNETVPAPTTPYLTKAQADSLYAAAGGAGGSLADGAVTPAKLAAKAVTAAKLGDDVPAAIAASPELRAALGSPAATYTYELAPDGTKRIKTETKGAVTMTYTYDDANGGRVKTQSDGITTWTFNYDADSLITGVAA